MCLPCIYCVVHHRERYEWDLIVHVYLVADSMYISIVMVINNDALVQQNELRICT